MLIWSDAENLIPGLENKRICHEEDMLTWHALKTLSENTAQIQFSTSIFAHHTSAGPPSCPAAVSSEDIPLLSDQAVGTVGGSLWCLPISLFGSKMLLSFSPQ